MNKEPEESLVDKNEDPFICFLNKIVVVSVKVLAALMVVVIIWGVIDVMVHLYQNLQSSFLSNFDVENLLTTLGTFLAVLIAIEIFLNIIFYLKKDAIHVPLVLGTALTAVARKVIILDYSTINFHNVYAIAAVILAVGISYWLTTKESTIAARDF